MDVWHHDDDERLVRAVLQYAFPAERPIFSQRRGAQIIHAAAVEALALPRRRHPFAAGRIAACLAATVTLLAGTASVAGAALPGEPLYPIKRAVERAMVAITGDDVRAARLELRFAERRLQEAAEIVDDTGDQPPPEVAESVSAHLDAAATLGGEAVATEVEELERDLDAVAADDPAGVEAQAAADTDVSQATSDEPPATPDPSAVAAEPSPTASPSPTATPSPTASPLPTPSPSPTPDPYGDDAPPGAVGPTPSASPSPTATPTGAATPKNGSDAGGALDPLSGDYVPLPNGVPGPRPPGTGGDAGLAVPATGAH